MAQPPSAPASAPVVAAPAPPAIKPAAVPVVPKNTEAAEDEVASARRVRSSGKQLKVQPAYPKQSIQTVPVPADIKLSGIAWQDERSGRRAVINDFLLKEGAVVAGATIIDIQAGKVRFATPAGQFEIKLNAVLPPESKK